MTLLSSSSSDCSYLFIVKRPKKDKQPEEPDRNGTVSEEEHPVASEDTAPLLPKAEERYSVMSM